MAYPILQWALLIAGWGVQLALFVVVLRARLFRTFPFFTSYIVWALIRTPVIMATGIYGGYRTDLYAITYWIANLVGWSWLFLVILELYENALRSYPGLRRFFRAAILFGTGATTLLIVASLITQIADVRADQWLNTWAYVVQRSVRLAHAGLLLTLVVFLRWFQLPVLRWPECLMRAWLVVSSVDFAWGALRSYLGASADLVAALGLPVFYMGINCFLIAAVRKSGSEQEPQPAFVAFAGDRRQAVLNQLESIMGALRR